jgi:hypothetical protein
MRPECLPRHPAVAYLCLVRPMREIVTEVLIDSAIPTLVGLTLLFAYRAHPERVPPQWTPRRVSLLALFLIVGTVLLSVWGAYSHPH